MDASKCNVRERVGERVKLSREEQKRGLGSELFSGGKKKGLVS
jgi:hypothetical protein